MDDLSLSVVVPTYRRPDEVPGVMESLEAQTQSPDELIFVLRRGDSPTLEAVEQAVDRDTPFPVNRVEVATPGHLPPVRAGFSSANGDVVALIDDDARPEPIWAERMLRTFAEREELGVLAGRIVEPELDHPDLPPLEADAGRRSLPWPGRRAGGRSRRETPDGPVPVTGGRGANLAFRNKALEHLKVDMRLNVGVGRFYENDLCLQVRDAGWEVLYNSDVRVRHFPSPEGRESGLGERCRYAYTAGHNWTVVALKHTAPLTWIPFVLYWVLWGRSRAEGPLRWIGVKVVTDRKVGIAEVWWGLVGRLHGIRDVVLRNESFVREHPESIRRDAR